MIKELFIFKIMFLYLQKASSRRANMGYSLVLYGCDQQRCEQDVCHLPVKEVHSVVGL